MSYHYIFYFFESSFSNFQQIFFNAYFSFGSVLMFSWQIGSCFLCVTVVLTDITQMYALNGHAIFEITLFAFTD